MSELDVRIVKLEPMRVASAHGFGTNPEEQAWDKILDDLMKDPFFAKVMESQKARQARGQFFL